MTPKMSRVRPARITRWWWLGALVVKDPDKTRVATFFALAIPALLLAARPIHEAADIFWQIKIGQLILANGFEFTEQLCYRNWGEPMSWVGWLGQVIFASVHRAAGWEGVQAIHVVFYWAAFALVWRRIRKISLKRRCD